jgi:hypothetical protein
LRFTPAWPQAPLEDALADPAGAGRFLQKQGQVHHLQMVPVSAQTYRLQRTQKVAGCLHPGRGGQVDSFTLKKNAFIAQVTLAAQFTNPAAAGFPAKPPFQLGKAHKAHTVDKTDNPNVPLRKPSIHFHHSFILFPVSTGTSPSRQTYDPQPLHQSARRRKPREQKAPVHPVAGRKKTPRF